MDMNLSKFWEIVKNREVCRAAVCESQRVGHNLVTEQQPNTSLHPYINDHMFLFSAFIFFLCSYRIVQQEHVLCLPLKV